MLFASIDIGSNAVRLLFANVYENNDEPNAAKATLVRIPLRLGEDVFQDGIISEKRIQKLISTMKAFKLLIDVYEPVNFSACATAAMREAANNKQIIERIYNEVGIQVKIIDGQEEANIIRASNNLSFNNDYSLSMYIDVGGGSTEISVLRDHKFVKSYSFNIGTVRLLNNKVDKSEWDHMKEWIQSFKSDFGKINCIGTGGNINKLTKMYGNNAINSISFLQLQYGYKQLKDVSLKDRIEKFGMRPDRADVIIPAAKIYLTIMKTANIEAIVAPRVGLVDGLIYELYDKYKQRTQK